MRALYPALGQFLSPDTLVPDAGLVLDYNRYMYARGNPVKYTDPTGHLSLDEIHEFFGYSVDEYDRMVSDWGQAATEQLWDTSFTWGDVLSYDGGDAMLVLFEHDDDSRYQGGFWGITGERRGMRVSRDVLQQSTSASKNVALTDDMAEMGLSGIPIRINSAGRYDYYSRNYYEYGLVANIVAVNTLVTGAWEIAHRANYIAKAVPGWLQWATVVSDLYFAAGILLDGHTGISLPLVDQSIRNIYPVMAGWRPQGMGPIILGGSAPRGFYDR